jgi:hypothetical protein
MVYVAGHATPFLVVHADQQALLAEGLVALLAPYPVVIAVVPPAVALLYGVKHAAVLFMALESRGSFSGPYRPAFAASS